MGYSPNSMYEILHSTRPMRPAAPDNLGLEPNLKSYLLWS
jgi:hypothetical protein